MAGAKRYRAYYIEPGLADYTAEGVGLVLVQKPALDKMNPTFVGMPVVNFEHTDLEPDELFDLDAAQIDEFADGVVAATGYDPDTGWYFADMMIWDEETQNNVDNNGYSVSCAYDVIDAASGGSYHNVDYQEEVLDGQYKHMAIVPNPRYEDAWIIRNSKPTGGTAVLGKKKRRENMPKPDNMENTEDMDNRYVMRENGDKMPLNELVAQYKEMKAASNAEDEELLNEEDMVEVDGEQMRIKDMLTEMGMMENPGDHMVNADDEDDMDNSVDPVDTDVEPVIDEKRQNARVKGKANMQKVRNAARRQAPVELKVDTPAARIERGRERYGSPVRQEV